MTARGLFTAPFISVDSIADYQGWESSGLCRRRSGLLGPIGRSRPTPRHGWITLGVCQGPRAFRTQDQAIVAELHPSGPQKLVNELLIAGSEAADVRYRLDDMARELAELRKGRVHRSSPVQARGDSSHCSPAVSITYINLRSYFPVQPLAIAYAMQGSSRTPVLVSPPVAGPTRSTPGTIRAIRLISEDGASGTSSPLMVRAFTPLRLSIRGWWRGCSSGQQAIQEPRPRFIQVTEERLLDPDQSEARLHERQCPYMYRESILRPPIRSEKSLNDGDAIRAEDPIRKTRHELDARNRVLRRATLLVHRCGLKCSRLPVGNGVFSERSDDRRRNSSGRVV